MAFYILNKTTEQKREDKRWKPSERFLHEIHSKLVALLVRKTYFRGRRCQIAKQHTFEHLAKSSLCIIKRQQQPKIPRQLPIRLSSPFSVFVDRLKMISNWLFKTIEMCDAHQLSNARLNCESVAGRWLHVRGSSQISMNAKINFSKSHLWLPLSLLSKSKRICAGTRNEHTFVFIHIMLPTA